MDKFCWKENEVIIAKSQCELCEFQSPKCKESCAKYESKPAEVLSNTINFTNLQRKEWILYIELFSVEFSDEYLY